jgi:transcriptional regulator with GAF, ATPase, and Fis domain
VIEYKALYEISTLLNSQQDIRALIRLAIDKVIECTGAQRGMLLILGPDDEYQFECARNRNKTEIRKPDSEISRTIIKTVLASSQTQVLENALNDPNFDVSASIRELQLLSIACAPLRVEGEVFGVIYIDSRVVTALFDADTQALLEELSKLISPPIKNSLSLKSSIEKQQKLISQIEELKGYDQLIGTSPAMVKLLTLIDKIADSNATVLISGESGTGKELIARRLHQKSSRKEHELVLLDCSTIAENLMEAELFGYEKGAFTGADKSKPGWFEVADKGAIFLDEIGELSAAAQKKLLRLIQYGDFTPLGSKKMKRADVRIIAATNRNLAEMVHAGTFREDLFYRINVIELPVSPLRERREDIPALARYFIEKLAAENKKLITGLTPAALHTLQTYDYPGNIRELRNIIHYAVLLCKADQITEEDLPMQPKSAAADCFPKEANFMAAKQKLIEAFEKTFVIKRLKETKGNITQAAVNAGMYKSNFIDKMKQYAIDAKDFKD